MKTGTLYLIPTPLGEVGGVETLPATVLARVRALECFIVESPKTARAFLKAAGHRRPLATLRIDTLAKETPPEAIAPLLEPLLNGADAGLLSEAGAPAVADPGATLVRLAHDRGVRVVPLVGPSALLLALMASGLDGQRFAFHGYLPVNENELGDRLKALEAASQRLRETQIFIETPYRNDRLLRVIGERCDPRTLLSVATNLTQPDESVRTDTVAAWRARAAPIGKRPSVFLLLAQG